MRGRHLVSLLVVGACGTGGRDDIRSNARLIAIAELPFDDRGYR